ncbi:MULTISPECIES: hypothetical protein [Mesorhizobium]|nr:MULTISPECIES: hypothetical protein [Mesorhizobium]
MSTGKTQPVHPISQKPVHIEEKGLSSANLQTALQQQPASTATSQQPKK